MPDHNDDFYIGYKPRTSPALAGKRRVFSYALSIFAAICGALLAWGQGGFSDAAFEYGNVQEFEGRLAAGPYPVLHLDGKEGAGPHLLVDVGKRGVRQEIDSLDGQRVRTSGQLIYRDEGRMIELSDRIEGAGSASPILEEISAGHHTLIGEIVDNKCYLGVMKPGTGKPHRSCAARCISGGVPPSLLVKGSDGSSRLLLLSDEDGQPMGPEILGLVAQPVSVTGAVSKRDGLWYIQAASEDIRRWHGGAV